MLLLVRVKSAPAEAFMLDDMSDAFDDMRLHILDRLMSYDADASADEVIAFDWRLEVMDRIEALERFLDRDEGE